ncbi:OmpA family protein [compost metagenome]
MLIRDTQLRGYKAHLVDRAPSPEVPLDIGPLDLDLQNLDSQRKSPLTLKLKTGLGNRGQVETSGQVALDPISARLKVATRDIDLRIAQSYIIPFIRLELRSGFLSSNLDVDLKSTEPLAFSVGGSAQVTQLHTLDTLKSRDFVKWQQLTLDGLAYQHGDSLAIQSLSLEEPYARFIINEDRTTNVSELIIEQPGGGASASAGKSGSSAQPAGKPLGIRIGGIKVNNGSANFADLTLRPDFATAIQQLGGSIGAIDNRNPRPASVDFKGKVDKYAPVSIKGSLNPFSPLEQLDIATSFKRVELTTLTPYSGKFAGYRIRKGRLNLDLHYKITKGQLNAENKVLVEKLQLGERVESPDAVDLPVKLAVALLKDANGNIDIQLPVSGDLNNPQFSVMPIVWQTLRNLIVRAVQAPFKFIAGLAGGGDPDMGSVTFSAGSSELSGGAQGRLDKLAAALKQRPALRLEVEGVSAASSDGPLLAEQRLQQEFQSNYYRILQRRGEKLPSDASQLEVPEDLQPALLEGIYRTRLKQQPPTEWKELDKEERTAKLRQAALDSWSKSELLLRKLAQTRATQIKDYLVSKGGLPDERVYLIDVSLGEAENNGDVISQLNLDSE